MFLKILTRNQHFPAILRFRLTSCFQEADIDDIFHLQYNTKIILWLYIAHFIWGEIHINQKLYHTVLFSYVCMCACRYLEVHGKFYVCANLHGKIELFLQTNLSSRQHDLADVTSRNMFATSCTSTIKKNYPACVVIHVCATTQRITELLTRILEMAAGFTVESRFCSRLGKIWALHHLLHRHHLQDACPVSLPLVPFLRGLPSTDVPRLWHRYYHPTRSWLFWNDLCSKKMETLF